MCTLLSNAFALLPLNRFDTIEHSENRIIFQSEMFENKIGPGVLQSSVRQTRELQEYEKHKPGATDYIIVDSVRVVRNFAEYMFVDYWRPEHPRSNLVFEMCDNFISEFSIAVYCENPALLSV